MLGQEKQDIGGVMRPSNRKLAQKIIAVVVIVALLDFVGVSPTIIIFFVGIGFLIWRAAQRAESRETERIFDFYISADEILRDKERHWYGFEVTEVINDGEAVMHSMPDPPPLSYFALGALYHVVGDHASAIENFSLIVEEASSEELYRSEPSPQLRRYVETLRKIEREPSLAPQVMAATRSLERARRKSAADLLAESRVCMANNANNQGRSYAFPRDAAANNKEPLVAASAQPIASVTPPPPICDVLHDVYPEEKTA
jgi:hypothetical protein